jgi:hypothetical protein
MTARLTLVTIKQYRFEIGFAVLLALLATGFGLVIHMRLDALGVSQDCLNLVRASDDGTDLEAECFRLARAGAEILGSTYLNNGGVLQLSIMGLLPFVLGVFGGIPVVARELEDRTAQTAWWLNGSRSRWLLRKLGPILLVLGVAIGLAAIVASLVAEDWLRWYGAERANLLGTYGPLAIVRAFGAFGLGLAAGAILGRTFPAFVVSVTLLLLVMVIAIQARDAWLAQLPLEALWERSPATGQWESIGGVPRAVAWGGPEGEILTSVEARQRATDANVPPAQPDDPYDLPASEWLTEKGYAEIALGTTDQAAAGWAPFDVAVFMIVGSVGLATSFLVVRRRRPT